MGLFTTLLKAGGKINNIIWTDSQLLSMFCVINSLGGLMKALNVGLLAYELFSFQEVMILFSA